MPREGGASSTPRPPDFTAPALEYWIARLRGRRRLGCDAGDRNDPVIASEAKQSIAQRQEKSGLLRCFAPRNGRKRNSAFSRRNAPEVCMNFRPIEGVGNAGCPRTRSPCAG